MMPEEMQALMGKILFFVFAYIMLCFGRGVTAAELLPFVHKTSTSLEKTNI